MGKYTLIITEKPDAANRIAVALDVDGKPKKNVSNGVPYYSAFRGGNIVVVPALGHLFTITTKEKGQRYPVFEYKWVPRYQAERDASRIRVWIKVIAQLAKDAEGFVDACDFDVEGSIIGYTILKYVCDGKEATAKRMRYSTLTIEELQNSYTHLLPTLDFALVEAGLARHEVDWLYGINLSRALTQAAKKYSGQYTTLSTGRVQGPTLKFIEVREKTINSFVPTPYWTIMAKITIDDKVFEVEYEKMLENKFEATTLKDACKTREGRIDSVEVKEFLRNPQVPFDLGALQSEAYRIFKYTPIRTSSVAQKLYLQALISYPRTSSQKLPSSIDYRNILKRLQKAPTYTKLAADLLSKKSLKPNEGKKYDSAHPAIYPTGNLPEKPLGNVEGNIFDLVVKRFLSVFGEPPVQQNISVKIDINGNFFLLDTTRTLAEGWIRFYKPYVKTKEVSLPPLIEGQKVYVEKIVLKNNFTNPPSQYNPRSLLMKMEKEEIGTKATRAATIQTLNDRKYLSGITNLSISDLGLEIIEVLSKYCPTVVSSEMTKVLEERMEAIQQGNETKQNVLQNTTETLKLIISEFKENEATIGGHIGQSFQKNKQVERTVGACPKCVGGKLVILRSKKTGKRFVGCTNYFDGKCNTTFPLPQTGTVKPLGKVCKSCGSPIVAVYLRVKHPWKLCLNMNCPTKGGSKH